MNRLSVVSSLKKACSLRSLRKVGVGLGMLITAGAAAAQQLPEPPLVVLPKPTAPNQAVNIGHKCPKGIPGETPARVQMWDVNEVNGQKTRVITQIPLRADRAAHNCIIDELTAYERLHLFARYPASLRNAKFTYPQFTSCRAKGVPGDQARIWRNGVMSTTELPYAAVVEQKMGSQAAQFPLLLDARVTAVRNKCSLAASQALIPGTLGYTLGLQPARAPFIGPSLKITR